MFVYGQVIKSSLIQSGFIELVVLHCEKQILTQVPSETHLDILAESVNISEDVWLIALFCWTASHCEPASVRYEVRDVFDYMPSFWAEFVCKLNTRTLRDTADKAASFLDFPSVLSTHFQRGQAEYIFFILFFECKNVLP